MKSAMSETENVADEIDRTWSLGRGIGFAKSRSPPRQLLGGVLLDIRGSCGSAQIR